MTSRRNSVVRYVCNDLKKALDDQITEDSTLLLRSLASLLEAGYDLPSLNWNAVEV